MATAFRTDLVLLFSGYIRFYIILVYQYHQERSMEIWLSVLSTFKPLVDSKKIWHVLNVVKESDVLTAVTKTNMAF